MKRVLLGRSVSGSWMAAWAMSSFMARRSVTSSIWQMPYCALPLASRMQLALNDTQTAWPSAWR